MQFGYLTSEIPGFVQSTVEGHAGQLVIGEIGGVAVAVQQGRFHFYEGYDMEQVTLPVRAFGVMGVKNLILTNAAGSLNSDMLPGSLMLITDHLNCMGVNPLRGANDTRFGPRFPDMTEVYDREFYQIAETEAAVIAKERFENGVDSEQTDFLNRGVYCALSGPTYETPAEIRMYRLLGADAVGMSTVPGVDCCASHGPARSWHLVHNKSCGGHERRGDKSRRGNGDGSASRLRFLESCCDE